MVYKRKKRKVHKANLEIQEPKQSPKQPDSHKPDSIEALVTYNGTLVEILYQSEVWEIIQELLLEMKASVSGRFTNGRFYEGELTRTERNRDELAGYQMAIQDFNNRLNDFVVKKKELHAKKLTDEKESRAPIYNPFLEGEDEE